MNLTTDTQTIYSIDRMYSQPLCRIAFCMFAMHLCYAMSSTHVVVYILAVSLPSKVDLKTVTNTQAQHSYSMPMLMLPRLLICISIWCMICKYVIYSLIWTVTAEYSWHYRGNRVHTVYYSVTKKVTNYAVFLLHITLEQRTILQTYLAYWYLFKDVRPEQR